MGKPGRRFEEAVYDFVRKLDPSAEVLFDHSVPDRDTGTYRQCDVWINAKLWGHIPFSVLVSCKDHSRKLNISDIGTFCNEVRSTRANLGIIYSKAGFTRPALEKAQANRISCCRLYEDEPADMPESIAFEYFACNPAIGVHLLEGSQVGEISTWGELFSLKLSQGHKTTVLEAICAEFAKAEEEAISSHPNKRADGVARFPEDRASDLMLADDEIGIRVGVRVTCHWKQYRARAEATLLRGSYCLTAQAFMGSQLGPVVDMRRAHPGDAWAEIAEPETSLPGRFCVYYRYGGDVVDALRSQLGPRALR